MKFKSKYRHIFALLFVLGMIAILITQVFYLKKSYQTQRDVLKQELTNIIRDFEYEVFMNTTLFNVIDSSNVYFLLKKNEADSTFNFKGSVRISKDPIKTLAFDTTLLALRKKQVEEFYSILNKNMVQNEGILEDITIRFSQLCKECPGRDYTNYPLDSLFNAQLVKVGNHTKINDDMYDRDFSVLQYSTDTSKTLKEKKTKFNRKVSFGIYDKKSQKWKHISANTDTTQLKKDYLVETHFTPADNRETVVYAMIADESQIILGRIMLSLLLSLLLVLLILFSFLYFLREISRQKKLSEIKNDFINNMTHELKTPIANIILGIDNIENDKIIHKPELIKNFSPIIRKESMRLNGLVESVLEVAQLEQNNIKFNLKELDAHQIIQELIKSWQLQVAQKGGELKLDLKAEQAKIVADKTHFSNSISNLIDNAIKYSPDSPKIELSTTSSDNFFSISIKDNGLGIEKKELKNIFNKFYRIPTQNLHNVKGFGIGLNYVKDIISIFNGDISVKSELGKGSTFTIKLPLT